MKSQSKVPTSFYIFGVLVVLALTVVAVIPASMVYRLRVFDSFGLPDWLVEVVRFLILVATPVAVCVTGLVRVFAVSDADHAGSMNRAAIFEMIACVLEIVAALINGSDIFAIVGQAITMGGAIALVFGALVLTLTSNGFYKLAIAEREQALIWNKEFNDLFKQTMRSDEAHAEMLRAVQAKIQDEVEHQTGRRMYTHPIKDGGETPEVVPVAERGNGKGKGTTYPN